MVTLYFDVIYEFGGWEIKNQSFYEAFDNFNENQYGFSQFHDSWVFENKTVLTKEFDFDFVSINTQLSPSVRHTDFEHGDDFFFEYFHRRDLSAGDYGPTSDRLLATEEWGNFSNYVVGEYTDYAIAALFDVNFEFGLNVLLGIRQDQIEAESRSIGELEVFNTSDSVGDDSQDATSWNASISYDIEIPGGQIIPYYTAAEQSVVVAGQGAELQPSQLSNTDNGSTTGEGGGQSYISATELTEFGIKGSFLDDRLFAAIAYYEQERTDRNVQSITVNQDIRTEGIEAEARFQVTDNFLVTAAYTKTEVINETILGAGSQFSFLGIEDLTGVTDQSLHLGGQPFGLVALSGTEDAAKRAGIPENLYSFTATYEFDSGLSFSASVVDVEEVFSGQSQAVELPAYTLVDLSAAYDLDDWLFRVAVKNATDEEYFRANFTELFGSTIVLPEKPRSVEGSIIYRF